MNKLINEQRNMMDFSNNIKINEPDINKDTRKSKKKIIKVFIKVILKKI